MATTSNSVHFDLQKELELALKWTLDNMKELRQKSPDWHVGYYFSATDLERRIRSAADEISMGVPYGTYQNHGGYGTRILGLEGYTLLDHCRSFLTKQVRAGKLRADQPSNKRTISGMRFRPVDEELTEAEKETENKRKENRTIWHYDGNFEEKRDNSKDINFALCQKNKTRKTRSWRNPRNRIRLTKNPEDVTCKSCLRIMENMSHPLTLNSHFPPLKLTVDVRILADWLEDNGKEELATHYRNLWKEKEKKHGQI